MFPFGVFSNLIESTYTRTGLKVTAKLDSAEYEAGGKTIDEEMEHLNLKPHALHPQGQYTTAPKMQPKKGNFIPW